MEGYLNKSSGKQFYPQITYTYVRCLELFRMNPAVIQKD